MLTKYLSYFLIFFTTLASCSQANLYQEPHERFARSPTQFRNAEMMTARGFGKRDTWQSRLIDRLMNGFNDNKRGAVNAEPRLRFRMDNDDGLRIGRGFGKRASGQKEEYTRPWSSPSIKDWNDAERLLQYILQNEANEAL